MNGGTRLRDRLSSARWRERLGSARWRHHLRRTLSFVLGWALTVAGIVLIPLPGPGTIILVAGVALLSQHYVWAQKLLDPLQKRAIDAAILGVKTWPRITMSALGGLWLFSLGVLWLVSPSIPEFDLAWFHLGPRLPLPGWGTGIGLVSSAFVCWGLLAYSVKRWR